MIKNNWKVICEECFNTIIDYDESPSVQSLEEEGIVISEDKHFCNDDCESRYMEDRG